MERAWDEVGMCALCVLFVCVEDRGRWVMDDAFSFIYCVFAR